MFEEEQLVTVLYRESSLIVDELATMVTIGKGNQK
jgi:hypothetical protein